MKKITHLLLLCVLMIVSAFTAKAQTAAVMQTSAAPDDNGFAPDTHWYTMRVRNCYISVENVDANSYIKVSEAFDPFSGTIDKALWCIVGNETKGYKLYNKSEGATKVLAVKYIADDDNHGKNAWTKMVDANIADATTTGGDSWRTTFQFHKNTNSYLGAYTISAKGLTNYYFNRRDPYLACWFSSDALEEVGSSFYFYDIDSYLSSSSVYSGTSYGGLFQPTQEEYETFVGNLNTIKAGATWENLKSKIDEFAPLASTFRSTIVNHKPELGKKYLIKNNYFKNQMIIPNVIPGGTLDKYTGDDNKVKSAVWIFEQGSTEGTYKLKNAYSGLYVNGTKVNTTGSDLQVGITGVYNGTFAIGTSFSGNNSLHSNRGYTYLILWEANAGASRWVAEAINDEAYEALNANVPQAVNSLLSSLPTDILESATDEKAALQADPSYSNYLACKQAIKNATDNQYVRLQCAKGGNDRMLGVNDAYSATSAVESSTKNTAVSNIWKLVPIDNEVGYKLLNVNTNKYITNLPDADGEDRSLTAQLTSEIGQGCKFTFTVKNAANKTWNVIDNIIDGNNKKLNGEKDGRINYWTDNRNDGWKITKATDIEVDLHALGKASYASVYLPFGVSKVEGAKAYVAENAAENNSLVVKTTADGGFGANTGVVLVSDSKAEKATLTIGDHTNTSSMLTGSNTPVILTDDTRSSFFVFGPKDGETSTVGFWTPASNITTIPANRAYYQNANGHAVALVFDGCTTGIEGVTINGSNENVQAPIFDLAGRRVANVVKGGVYIQNGKKFIK